MPLAKSKPTGPYSKETGEVRFWSRVTKGADCWLWTGYKLRGYGAFWVARRFYYAHRYSWQLHNGDIPGGLCVLHNCPGGDNPLCVNPAHLFLGTNRDNVADRDQKGRQCKGVRHWCAKLNDELVRMVRRRHVPGCRVNGARPLARELGVSKPVIDGIVKGRGWKHADQEPLTPAAE